MAERTSDHTREEDTDAPPPDTGAGRTADGRDRAKPEDTGLNADLGTDVGGDVDADHLLGRADVTKTGSRATDSRSLASRAGGVFSPTSMVVQSLAALVGVFVVGDLIPLVPFAGFAGLFVLTAIAGTLSRAPRYVEAAIAGAGAGALAVFLGSLTLSVVTGGALPAVGGVVGALAGLLGHYVGRDLRDGLTRDID